MIIKGDREASFGRLDALPGIFLQCGGSGRAHGEMPHGAGEPCVLCKLARPPRAVAPVLFPSAALFSSSSFAWLLPSALQLSSPSFFFCVAAGFLTPRHAPIFLLPFFAFFDAHGAALHFFLASARPPLCRAEVFRWLREGVRKARALFRQRK
nr:hypothetical protein [Pandoravirus belohorizontensis]